MNKYPKGFLSQNLENCRAQKTCEGGFEGEARVVRVIDKSHSIYHDWGYYAYSDRAIQQDVERGFTVLFEGDEGFGPKEE
jgi:hypothetical protein